MSPIKVFFILALAFAAVMAQSNDQGKNVEKRAVVLPSSPYYAGYAPAAAYPYAAYPYAAAPVAAYPYAAAPAAAYPYAAAPAAAYPYAAVHAAYPAVYAQDDGKYFPGKYPGTIPTPY